MVAQSIWMVLQLLDYGSNMVLAAMYLAEVGR